MLGDGEDGRDFLSLQEIFPMHPYPIGDRAMALPRASGILLHPTSLPGPYGIGELGPEALAFIDALAAAHQQFWQVLPLGPTGYGNSPYMCYSAVAGNPLLISLDVLCVTERLERSEVADMMHLPQDHVDFDRCAALKYPLLRIAFDRFKQDASLQPDYLTFCKAKAVWLDDYAMFMALKQAHGGQPWYQWEPDIAKRKPEALNRWRDRLVDDIEFHKYMQFEFFRQWCEVKAYAKAQKIQIIGDIPIYVAHDSADVWANPGNFQLDEAGEVEEMAGVPPDYFSDTGQLWGNPVYNWEYLQKHNFAWWIARFEALLDYVDWIRIDHFRGFEAFWSVPKGETTAMNGEWITAPGEQFFVALEQSLGKLPILAEDLGVITPEVEALRDRFSFPGMKVLHFAFGSDPGNAFLPFNYPRNAVVYTGTHDNNTTVGWFQTLSDWERQNLMTQIGTISSEGIHWDLIRQALGSVASLSILPLQDVMGLGNEARMNFPGVAEGNWGWRYHSSQMTDWMVQRLQHMTQRMGRSPQN
jgi:4-alpha-glucanotransferase